MFRSNRISNPDEYLNFKVNVKYYDKKKLNKKLYLSTISINVNKVRQVT